MTTNTNHFNLYRVINILTIVCDILLNKSGVITEYEVRWIIVRALKQLQVCIVERVQQYSGMHHFLASTSCSIANSCIFFHQVIYICTLILMIIDALTSRFEALFRFGCGVSAGLLACALTQPFDMVKTRMQVMYRCRNYANLECFSFMHRINIDH